MRTEFKCPECPRTFFKKYNREVHLRTHYNTKPFACSLCQGKFTQKCNLNRHIRQVHKIIPKTRSLKPRSRTFKKNAPSGRKNTKPPSKQTKDVLDDASKSVTSAPSVCVAEIVVPQKHSTKCSSSSSAVNSSCSPRRDASSKSPSRCDSNVLSTFSENIASEQGISSDVVSHSLFTSGHKNDDCDITHDSTSAFQVDSSSVATSALCTNSLLEGVCTERAASPETSRTAFDLDQTSRPVVRDTAFAVDCKKNTANNVSDSTSVPRADDSPLASPAWSTHALLEGVCSESLALHSDQNNRVVGHHLYASSSNLVCTAPPLINPENSLHILHDDTQLPTLNVEGFPGDKNTSGDATTLFSLSAPAMSSLDPFAAHSGSSPDISTSSITVPLVDNGDRLLLPAMNKSCEKFSQIRSGSDMKLLSSALDEAAVEYEFFGETNRSPNFNNTILTGTRDDESGQLVSSSSGGSILFDSLDAALRPLNLSDLSDDPHGTGDVSDFIALVAHGKDLPIRIRRDVSTDASSETVLTSCTPDALTKSHSLFSDPIAVVTNLPNELRNSLTEFP